MKPEVSLAWKKALDFWDSTPQLDAPVDVKDIKGDPEVIAYINMGTRQVVYNFDWLKERGITDSLPAIFAHELGHHLRFPHSLKVSAELHLLAESLIPGLPFHYINIFWDLLINEVVGQDPELRKQLISVYKGSLKGQTMIGELYASYLTVYEYLWDIEGHFDVIVDNRWRPLLQRFPQEFYQLESFHDQFLYFLSFFVRFIKTPDQFEYYWDPFLGDAGVPQVGDYPAGGEWTPVMSRALSKARGRNWFPGTDDGDASGDNFRKLQDALRSLPGTSEGLLTQAADRHYRLLIERFIDALPKRMGKSEPEAFIPSVTEGWEAGDELQDIDWLESLSRSGEAAAATLLKREKIADDPEPLGDKERPQMEIYLDTSGSMPSPVSDTNMMTLAALILSAYAIRKGGKVRGVIYSSGDPIISDWMQAEDTARLFFLQYIGGGTDYPFDLLEKFSQERDKTYRIIISDQDFIYNLGQTPAADKIVSKALARSERLVTVLAHVDLKEIIQYLPTSQKDPRFSLVPVTDPKDFATVSARLARGLLGEIA